VSKKNYARGEAVENQKIITFRFHYLNLIMIFYFLHGTKKWGQYSYNMVELSLNFINNFSDSESSSIKIFDKN